MRIGKHLTEVTSVPEIPFKTVPVPTPPERVETPVEAPAETPEKVPEKVGAPA